MRQTANEVRSAPNAPAIPGMRISNYRNSTPRAIRLIGLGAAAAEIVRGIGRLGLSNVAITFESTVVNSRHLLDAAATFNMLVIVCSEGDEGLFQPAVGRLSVPVTFVMLQQQSVACPAALEQADLLRVRSGADLFVTTADRDYVRDLIVNLAS